MDMMWYRRRGLMVTPHIESVTGAIASFNSDYNKIPIKSLICDIEPIQEGEGDPSPENVRPISGRTEVSVMRMGVNLAPLSGWAGHSGIVSDMYLNIPPNTTFTVSFNSSVDVATDQSVIIFIFEDGSISGWNGFKQGSVSFTKTYTKKITGLQYYSSSDGWIASQNVTLTVTDFQIELGSTATDYEPYKGSTYSVNWETEAGSVYGGSLDVVSGKLVVTHRYWTDNGSKTWVQNPDGSFYTPLGTELPEQIVDSGCCCNYSPYKISFTDYCVFARVNGLMSLGAKWGDFYTDVTALKAAFAETPLQVVYKLATPIEIQLTPQEIKTLLVNNIWCDSGDVSVDYWKWGK